MEKKRLKKVLILSLLSVFCATFVMVYYTIERAIENETEVLILSENKTEPGCPFWDITNDGYCDDEANIEECNYDYGDCCYWENDFSLCQDCYCKTPPLNYTEEFCDNFRALFGYSSLIGNGNCDRLLNNQEYAFDAGDCCNDQSSIGDEWFVCVKSDMYCIEDQIGDGICQDVNNTPWCYHDLGDCCIHNRDKTKDLCCECICGEDAIYASMGLFSKN